ncbi:MAG: hypothetical protein J7L53_02380 [Deltaproteobacteria bacterium]|nr:hypothetical protein [Deltaproteobacteria bacterium]
MPIFEFEGRVPVLYRAKCSHVGDYGTIIIGNQSAIEEGGVNAFHANRNNYCRKQSNYWA